MSELEIKEQIRKELLSRLDTKFFLQEENILRQKIEDLIKAFLTKKRLSLSRREYQNLVQDMVDELLGLGPIEKLIQDPSVWEIMVNGPEEVYVEREGRLELTPVKFRNEEHLYYFIEKILSPLGRRVTETEPYVDARLADGSRVNVIRPPVSLVGPVLTIRKFSRRLLKIDDLIRLGTLTSEAAKFLEACVKARLNIVISGGPSSGKTTTLNVLASFIPSTERIITIEDTAELQLASKHTVSLESRPPNIEGKGEITIRALLKNALHMRPDRIIIGEVRADETLDMLQAMNIGQQGSMTTIHANSCYDALLRLETMAMMASANITLEVIQRQIISAVDLIIQQSRLSDGSRWIMNISELEKKNFKEYSLKEIFSLKVEEVHPRKKVYKFLATGTPTFLSRLKESVDFSWEKVFKE